MATRTEVIDGLESLIRESHRIAGALTPGQWSLTVDQDGWKGTEMLAHVAGVGTLIIPFLQALTSAPAGADAMGNTDINAMNAGLVSARAGKSPADLAAEIDTAYSAVIEHLRGQPDEFFEQAVTMRGHKDIGAGDMLMRMTILHGLAHVYSAYSAVFFAA